MLYSLLKSGLFLLEPESAHAVALRALTYLPRWCFPVPKTSPHTVMGLQFPNQIGLAAGLDKSGQYIDGLAKLGFGFIEVGTVTPRAQTGNPKPRLFRLPQAQALINRLGFNNPGVNAFVGNLKRIRYRGVIGVNIGKGRDTPIASAEEDYLYCLDRVYPYASYVTINISSPNTPNLRQLQHKEYFLSLIQTLRQAQLRLADHYQRYVPLVIKVSPDESNETLKSMAEIIRVEKIDGIIVTNTTCSRIGVESLPHGAESGGLSGMPLLVRSTECLSLVKEIVGDDVALIGVGGVTTSDAALQKIHAGADLIQIYTGLIYQGPGLVSRLSQSLCGLA